MSNPSEALRVILVGTVPGARPATCDPAIDVAGTSPAVFSRYERERSVEAAADIKILPGMTPSVFHIQPLTSATWRWVQDSVGEGRYHRAFQAACHSYTNDKGVEVKAKVEQIGRVAIASDEWVEAVFDTYGAGAVREIAQVAIDRAEAGPRALAPFGLPRGLMLPR